MKARILPERSPKILDHAGLLQRSAQPVLERAIGRGEHLDGVTEHLDGAGEHLHEAADDLGLVREHVDVIWKLVDGCSA